MSKRKTAFLILRVDEDFKIRVVRKARNNNQTLSEFLREILERIK